MNLEEELMKNPLIKNPIKIVNVDYKDNYLIFTLSQKASHEWIDILNSHNYCYSCIMGFEPNKFIIDNNIAKIHIPERFNQCKDIVINFKDYIAETNRIYKEEKRGEIAEIIRQENEKEEKKAQEEKRREEILKQIKGTY